jgi:hypothetical protein
VTSALESRKVFALVVFLFAVAALVQFIYGDMRAVSSGMTLNTSNGVMAAGTFERVATETAAPAAAVQKVDRVCHGSTLPEMPWEVGEPARLSGNQVAQVKQDVDLVAHGSTFPPMPWERNTVTPENGTLAHTARLLQVETAARV